MKTSTVQIKVERKNGLFSNLGKPESVQQLASFRQDAGLTSARDNRAFAPFLETQGAISSLKKKAKELMEALDYYKIRVVGTTSTEIAVSTHELHCPHIEGAKATSEVLLTEKQTEDCSLEIFGVGGGDDFKISLGYGESLEAESVCVATIHSIPAIYELCEINTPDSRVVRFARLKSIDKESKRIEGVELSGNSDDCEVISFTKVPGSKEEKISVVKFDKAKYQKTLVLDVGWTWKTSAKVKLEKFGLEVGTNFLVEKTAKTELKYHLAKGKYIAYKPQNRLKWLWKVV